MSQSAAKKQRTLLGFFQKQPRSSSATPLPSSSPPPVPPRLQQASWEKARSDISKKAEGLCLATPQQSSDAIEAKEALLTSSAIAAEVDKENGPILPPTRGDCQANEVANQVFDNVRTLAAGRKVLPLLS